MKKVFLVFVAVCGFTFFACAQRYSDVGNFRTEVIDDGSSIQIIDYSGKGENVRIPPRINGLLVTSIGDEAFLQKELTGVVIPDSVTHIGDYAFSMNDFANVTIPNSVTHIGDSAFSHCQLTGITIPNSVTHIGNGAFAGNQLMGVAIPDSVIYMGPGVFRINENLKSIDVAPNNPNYSSSDGVLYNKDRTALLQWPQGKSGAVIIPNDVSHIGDWAFILNQLTGITIPDSVTHIGMGAFAFNQLTSVTIPDSVTNIEERAFWLNRLTDIVIPNSVVRIGNSAFLDNQLTSVVVSSYTQVEPDAFDSQVTITLR